MDQALPWRELHLAAAPQPVVDWLTAGVGAHLLRLRAIGQSRLDRDDADSKGNSQTDLQDQAQKHRHVCRLQDRAERLLCILERCDAGCDDTVSRFTRRRNPAGLKASAPSIAGPIGARLHAKHTRTHLIDEYLCRLV